MYFEQKLMVAMVLASTLLLTSATRAELIIVDTTDDHNDGNCGNPSVDCTLREAIIKANATVEADEISLVAGQVYTLTVGGGGEDSAFFGDLDIRSSDLIISGANKTIDVNGMEQAFDIDTFAESITVEIRNLTIVNGQTGVRARPTANVTLADVTIDNISTNGVLNQGIMVMERCTVSNCQIGVWGLSFSNTTMRFCTVRDNTQTRDPSGQGAGVVVNATATMNIFDSLIANNRSLRSGGGIFAQNTTLNVTDSRITGNRCGLGGQDGLGAGIGSFGTIMTVTRCLVDHNVGHHFTSAGGIAINNDFNPAIATITNTTISGNFAFSTGGMLAGNVADVDLDSCTITDNTAVGNIGGLFAGQFTSLRNTIIARNHATGGGLDCQGTIASLGYNLIGNSGACALSGVATGNQFNVDPMLAPLLNNGGGTLTHALLPGSPAIDRADPLNFPAEDQRNVPRPIDGDEIVGALPDIGAFEWPPDCNGNGTPDNLETDTDGDFLIDACDGCPNDPNKIEPGLCDCGFADIDTDGDGVLDCDDGCPNDINKTDPGLCGCGISDVDTDLDMTPDCDDNCDNDPDKIEPGLCGCGVIDDPTDSDGDDVIDCNDGCPDDPDKIEPGICDCGIADVDTDADGVLDCDDICEGGDDNIDCDGDGTPDFCDTEPDCDGNGKSDACDIDPSDPDGDGIVAPDCNDNLVPDECDIADGVEDDCNDNGLIDQCEIDPLTIVYNIRREDLINLTGACLSTPTRLWTDNRQPFGFSWQDRGQGIVTSIEIDVQPGWNCHTAGTSFGTTLNGFAEAPLTLPTRHCACNLSPATTVIAVPDLGNYLPGQVNTFLIGPPTTRIGLSPNAAWEDGVYAQVTVSFDQAAVTDCNSTGVLDECEVASGVVTDCDDNIVPDECEPDCNSNGTVDACDVDITDPDGDKLVSDDCNADGVPDECQTDCNTNGIPDDCDADPSDPDDNGSSSEDCNANSVPDECEDDCDGNGVPDECDLDPTDPDDNGLSDADCNGTGVIDVCDIEAGTSDDCDGNQVPDDCDLDVTDPDGNGLVAPDCNDTGIIDVCDIAAGTADDCNGNSVPDVCDFFGTIIYDIASDQVINGSLCGFGLLATMSDFGFSWIDTAPAEVTDVLIEINIGASCAGPEGTEHSTTLNGEFGGAYFAPAFTCSCTGEGAVVRVVPDPADYLVGQENVFFINDTQVNSVSFSSIGPLGDAVYSRVTVLFDNSAVVDANNNGTLDVCDPPGDFDNNGVLDLIDYSQFGPCLTGPVDPVGKACDPIDTNGDGVGDMLDFATFQNLFGP